MPTQNLENEIVGARAAFNATEQQPGPPLQALGERYCALLDKYLNQLRNRGEFPIARSPYDTDFGSRTGRAVQVDYKSSIEWADGERVRVLNLLESGKKASVKK